MGVIDEVENELPLFPSGAKGFDDEEQLVTMGNRPLSFTDRLAALRPRWFGRPLESNLGPDGHTLPGNGPLTDGSSALQPEMHEEPVNNPVLAFPGKKKPRVGYWQRDSEGDGQHYWKHIGQPEPGTDKYRYTGHLNSQGDWHPLRPEDPEDQEPPLRVIPGMVEPIYDKKRWKLSREKPGFLIKRIVGYDITEDKYGISYLFRLPKGRTTTDQGEHSGYSNWLALEAAGRLKKVGDPCTM